VIEHGRRRLFEERRGRLLASHSGGWACPTLVLVDGPVFMAAALSTGMTAAQWPIASAGAVAPALPKSSSAFAVARQRFECIAELCRPPGRAGVWGQGGCVRPAALLRGCPSSPSRPVAGQVGRRVVVRLAAVAWSAGLGCLRGTASAGRSGEWCGRWSAPWGNDRAGPRWSRRTVTLEATSVRRRDGARRRACVGGG
jgi:hypothetical protein